MKTATYNLKLDPDQKKTWFQAAEREHMKVAALITVAMNEYLIKRELEIRRLERPKQ